MLRDDTRIFTFKSPRLRCDLVARYDSPAIRALLLNLDREISHGSFQVFKNDRTTTVGSTSRDGRKLLLKRYNTKNAWHAVRRTVRRSRAENCFLMARLLRELHVNTPAPIALVEHRLGPLKGRSWFISEFVEGPLCLDYVLHHASPSEARAIALRIQAMFRELSKQRITHGDMKATNIILRNNSAPWLIDLDAMRQHRHQRSFEVARARDKERFRKNWRGDPERLHWFNQLDW